MIGPGGRFYGDDNSISVAFDITGVVLDGVSWADSEAMLGIIGERRIFVDDDSGTKIGPEPADLPLGAP